MSLDPATAAALITTLIARSDAQSFQLNQVGPPVPSGLTFTPDPAIPPCTSATFAPLTPARAVVLSWSATYRRQPLKGALVCDQGMVPLAQAVLVSLAQDCFNNEDQRLATLGQPLPIDSWVPGGLGP
jgi:hypothetical protein